MATGGSLASTTLNLDGGIFQLNGGSLFGGADINLNGGTFRAATDASERELHLRPKHWYGIGDQRGELARRST